MQVRDLPGQVDRDQRCGIIGRLGSHFGRRLGLVYIWKWGKRPYAVDETEICVNVVSSMYRHLYDEYSSEDETIIYLQLSAHLSISSLGSK